MDREYIVNDPVLGIVSVDDEAHARDFASKVGGVAGYRDWADGKVSEPVWLS